MIWTGILLLIVSVLYIKFLGECCNDKSHNLARIYCEFIVRMILLIIELFVEVLYGGAYMAVSYKKLWVTLAEKEMSRAELRKKAEIAPNTMTKLSRNEYVAMPILDKICKTLGTDYGDIMEYIPEKEKQM